MIDGRMPGHRMSVPPRETMWKARFCRTDQVLWCNTTLPLLFGSKMETKLVPGTTQSTRIQDFQYRLAAEIPKDPDDASTLAHLRQLRLTDFLIAYFSWRTRFVGKRSRNVVVEPSVEADARYQASKPGIDLFLAKVQNGEDLSPHLSRLAHEKGFAASGSKAGSRKGTWADKDRILNMMGFHHFHLGAAADPNSPFGLITRTSDVLFASVSRDIFEIIGIFSHEAFNDADLDNMTPERARLWQVYLDRAAKGNLPGALSIGGLGNAGVMMSGHPTVVVRAAQDYAKLVLEIDAKLNNPGQVASLLQPAPTATGVHQLRWEFDHLDLGIFDPSTNSFHIIRKGPS